MTKVNQLRLVVYVVALGVVAACSEGGHGNADGPGGAGGVGGAGSGGAAGGVGGAGSGGGAGGVGGAGSGGTQVGGRGGSFGFFPACPGRGGSGSLGSGGGSGGGPPVCPDSALPDCAGDGPACGDAKADACVVPTSSGFCQKQERREICDGTDLRGTTCEGLGFASGTLRCASTCAAFDASGCRTCTTDPSLLRCDAAPLALPWRLSMAGTDSELGLAFYEESATGRIELALARLSPSLDLLGKAHIPEEVQPWAEPPIVAPLPSGWVITWYSGTDLVMRALDTKGADLGRTVVADLNQVQDPYPQMVPRPDGGPLVFWWGEMAIVHAAVVAGDGRSATPPFTLPGQDRYPAASTGVYAAGAFRFLMAFSVYGTGSITRNVLMRIAPDGSSSSMDVLPRTDLAMAGATLIAIGDELRLVYTGQLTCDSPRATLMQRLALDGTTLGEPVVIGGEAERWGPIAFGSDLVSLFAVPVSPSFSTALQVERVSSSGGPVGPVHTIARGAVSELLMARRGPDVIVGWQTSFGLQLARVAP
jgi:hypothetical protein